MDTQQLSAFVAIAKFDSFSEAAEHLGLTQSAISKRIALLEEFLQQSLFDRVSRQIQLTEAGHALLPRAKQLLQDMDDTKRFMSDLNGLVAGSLSMATSHYIGLHRLPPVLKEFANAYPDVHLQLNFIDSEQAYQAILQGDFELALITLPHNPDYLIHQKHSGSLLPSQIQSHPIWEDPLVFVANKEHPLAKKSGKEGQLNLADFAPYPAILPDRQTYTTQLVQQAFDEKHQALNISMTSNHLDAISMMISVGLGWSVLPKTLINTHLEILNVDKPALVRQLGCIHHRGRTLSNAARAMLTRLRKMGQ